MGLSDCQLCPSLLAKHDPEEGPVAPLVGKGYRAGGICMVFDQPRHWDAVRGIMLGGRPGAAFDELVEEAGLSRADLFLTNSIRHRAPNGRIQDYPEALFACAAWTKWEMEAYQPGLVIAMGRVALQSVFGKEASVGSMRGTFTPLPAKHEWGQRPVMATYNPDAAQFDESVRGLIVQDLKAAKRMWTELSR